MIWRDFCGLVAVHEASLTGENVEITSPRAFTSGAIFVIAGCGVLLVAPVLASLLAVTLIKLGMLTVLIGLRALVEDADDLGYLSFTDSELIFQGDSVRLRIPWRQISAVRPQNIGWRGRYLYGSRIIISVTGIPNVDAVAFSERSSLLLPTSKRITKKLRERICAGKDSARTEEKSRAT